MTAGHGMPISDTDAHRTANRMRAVEDLPRNVVTLQNFGAVDTDPPRFHRRLQREYGWSLRDETTERAAIHPSRPSIIWRGSLQRVTLPTGPRPLIWTRRRTAGA